MDAEHLSRLKAMASPNQTKWDLSPNDQDAIRAAIAALEAVSPVHCLAGIFIDVYATLETIEKDGWAINGNMGGWWFEKKVGERRERQSAPQWVHGLIHEAEQRAKASVQREIQFAIGLIDGHGKPK